MEKLLTKCLKITKTYDFSLNLSSNADGLSDVSIFFVTYCLGFKTGSTTFLGSLIRVLRIISFCVTSWYNSDAIISDRATRGTIWGLNSSGICEILRFWGILLFAHDDIYTMY